jgi:hypothetical protein
MSEPLTLMQRSLIGVIVLLGSLCAWRYGEINIPTKADPVNFAEKSPVSYPQVLKPHLSRHHPASAYVECF